MSWLRSTIPTAMLLAALAESRHAAAQEGPLTLSRLAGSIALDGRPDEAAWDEATVLPLTMYTPVFRGSPAALDARASGNGFVQYNSTSDRLALNLRLRYNFSEGSDLWLVYDETLATERPDHGLTPLLPRSVSRGFMMKYTHTLRL